LLDAPLQFMATVTPHSNNDLLGFFERELELFFMAWLNVKLRNLKNHARQSEEAAMDSQSAFGEMVSQKPVLHSRDLAIVSGSTSGKRPSFPIWRQP
jgi:hypothetical protein